MTMRWMFAQCDVLDLGLRAEQGDQGGRHLLAQRLHGGLMHRAVLLPASAPPSAAGSPMAQQRAVKDMEIRIGMVGEGTEMW